MAIKLKSTRDAASDQGLKLLVHGPTGAGKTSLAATMPGKQIILSAEAGLLPLRHLDIAVIEVKSIDDVREAYQFIASKDGEQFESVTLDSVTEIAEVVLAAEKQTTKDPRQAYGELITQMTSLLRAFRDLPRRHVYMSCQQTRDKDEQSGAMLYGPSMPGAKLAQSLPYLFDEVFALRVERDAEGALKRVLQTSRDGAYEAKDRSGCLEQFESPDLAAVIQKISGSSKAKAA